MLKRVAVLSAIFGIACSKNSVSPKAAAEHTLEVVARKGVSGNPKAGIYKYPEGKSVQYSFSAETGFRNVVVEEGGNSLPLSGNVVMSADRKLSAVAELLPVMAPESEALSAEVMRFVATKDSTAIVSAYGEHLTALNDLYTKDPSHAQELALAAYANVLEKSSDADLDRVEKALSGHLITSSGSGLAIEKPGTTLIFVNGIWNWADAASVSLKGIESLVTEAGLSGRVAAYNFYNASLTFETSAIKRCLVRAIELRSFKQYIECGAVGGDILEATGQIYNLLNNLPNEELPKSKALAQIVREERSEGRAVILLGHSQGTLLVQEALKTIGADNCVSAISLAGPLGKASWKAEPSGFVVAGDKARDIILRLGYNDFERLPTNISRDADKSLEALGAVTPAFEAATKLFADSWLHLMTQSYLAGAESRDRIKKIISDETAALEKNTDCAVAGNSVIYASSGRIHSDGSSAGPSDLWSVSPRSDGADKLIARIRTASGFEPIITDLARSPDDALWGVSFTTLYKIDKASALAEEFMVLPDMSSANSLTFDSQGRLYVADAEGQIIGLELNPIRVFFNGSLGLRMAGDLANSPDGKVYASVLDGEGKNELAVIDFSTGRATIVGPIGFSGVWGLKFVGNVLFGLTADPAGSHGSLITIDTAKGKGTFVRNLAFNAFGASIRLP